MKLKETQVKVSPATVKGVGLSTSSGLPVALIVSVMEAHYNGVRDSRPDYYRGWTPPRAVVFAPIEKSEAIRLIGEAKFNQLKPPKGGDSTIEGRIKSGSWEPCDKPLAGKYVLPFESDMPLQEGQQAMTERAGFPVYRISILSTEKTGIILQPIKVEEPVAVNANVAEPV